VGFLAARFACLALYLVLRLEDQGGTSVALWRRRSRDRRKGFLYEPSAIDPLKSRENAQAFGVAFGIGQALGADPILTGAAALYAKAEKERRDAEEAARRPHAAGRPAGRRAGKPPG
jgi:hypothetical protein